MAQVIVSRRAALDLAEIEVRSTARWGQKVADGYIDSIEQALSLVQDRPGTLTRKAEISPHFHFYRVREHILVFAVTEETLYLLTVKYGGMDLPERLAELEPYLYEEIAYLHQKLTGKDG